MSSYAPSMVQSHRTLPPFTFPRHRNASEDADADTVSMYSESSSSTIDSADTALQNVDTEGKDLGASPNGSRRSSPDIALARYRSEWSPTAPQARYFVFPDPFSSGGQTSSSPKRTRSYVATSSEDEESIAEDKSETEGHKNTPLKNVSPERKTEQDPAPSANKETNQFLPLLKDEPNYPKNPTLNRGLEKINKRLGRATKNSEEPSAQSDKTPPISKIHPAFRQSESQPTIDNEAVTALQAEVRQLKADVNTLRQSANSRDSRQAEALRHLGRNQNQLVGGWGMMRDELFHIKVMQERLQRRVNSERSMNGRW